MAWRRTLSMALSPLHCLSRSLDIQCSDIRTFVQERLAGSKPKEHLIWRSEFETLDDATGRFAAYIESYTTDPTRGWVIAPRRRRGRPGRMLRRANAYEIGGLR